jgi:phosphoribosylanthranilate isomerase
VPGGTGQTVDWELVRRHRFTAPLILSGGLTPDNVAAAIELTQPFAVDVASGTERAPGSKDPDKLAAFARAVRAADGIPEPESEVEVEPGLAPEPAPEAIA